MIETDAVRCLALLWRAATDLDGAALFTSDDIAQADLLHVAGLGHVEKRRPKPHQLGFFKLNKDEMWMTYFVASERGRWLWSYVVGVVDEAAKGGTVPGWEAGF